MKKVDTWMPLYIGDYLADTMHLSAPEHGAYLLLLMHYWRNGPLPDDNRILAGIARTERKVWERQIGPAVREFFTVRDGRLHQKRIDAERAKSNDISEKRRAAANAKYGHANAPHVDGNSPANAPSAHTSAVGMASRNSLETDRNDVSDEHETISDKSLMYLDTAPANADLLDTHAGTRAGVPPSPSQVEREEPPLPPASGGGVVVQGIFGRGQQGPVTKLEDAPAVTKRGRVRNGSAKALEGFELFYSLYPRKVGEGQAEKAWPKAVAHCGGDFMVIIDGLNARLHLLMAEAERGYCKHPATWLNARGWKDAIPGVEDEDETALPLLTGGKG